MSQVDVIVPCYKYGRFLRECVESITSQSGVDLRVLILDDCSPDNTPEVAAELVSHDSRIEYRRHDGNRGHVPTYNEGLDWAAGDYTLLLSADDLVTPGSLKRSADFMDAHPDVGLVYGRETVFHTEFPADPPADNDSEFDWKLLTGQTFLEDACRRGINTVPTTTAVARKSLQKRLGGYRADLPHTNDMEMWMRLAAYSCVGVTTAVQGCYRRHGQNMSAQQFGSILADIRQREAAFAVLFREHGFRLTRCAELRQLAAEGLARDSARLAELTFWDASRAFDRGDVARCDELLELVVSVDPEFRLTNAWRRMRIKRAIGSRVWTRLRVLVDAVRLRGNSDLSRIA